MKGSSECFDLAHKQGFSWLKAVIFRLTFALIMLSKRWKEVMAGGQSVIPGMTRQGPKRVQTS